MNIMSCGHAIEEISPHFCVERSTPTWIIHHGGTEGTEDEMRL